jgi:peptidyl-prolyl cis-trans isomerase B (cyclophilin B)
MTDPLLLLFGLVPLVPVATAPEARLDVTWDVPGYFVPGERFEATLRIEARDGPCDVPLWYLTPGAFGVDGDPLGDRTAEGAIPLAAGDRIEATVDLSGAISATAPFWLECVPTGGDPVEVEVLARAPQGLDFMAMDASELAGYAVLMRTVSGPMLFELWPDVAPNHVRNFLDLAYTGFYDRTMFNRVWRGFMIQGGAADESGSGDGPRTLDAEFSDRRHVRGVLSMARLEEDENSASYQFFVMHADATPDGGLNGRYSAFGKLLSGYDTLDAIASQAGRPIVHMSDGSTRPDVRPYDKQWIERALVVLAPNRED